MLLVIEMDHHVRFIGSFFHRNNWNRNTNMIKDNVLKSNTVEFSTLIKAVMLGNENDMIERNKFLESMRDSRLSEVDTLERLAGISPRTSEIRAMWKEERRLK